MDADDIADSTRLTLQLKAFHDDPQLIACGTNYRTFGEQVNDIKTPQSDSTCKAILLIRSCFAHPTVMLRRRALVNNHLLYRDLGQAEDYDLWSRLAPFGKFRNLPQILLHYRIHSKQVSVEHTKDQQERHAQIASQNLSKVGLSLSPKSVSHLLWPSERNPILYLMKAFNIAFQLMFKSKGVNRISIIRDIFRIAITQASSMLFH